MAIEYKYPRVTISTLAKTHSVRMPERADTTVLFQPIYAKRGPVDKIVRLFTVDELITTYGEPDFATQGQGILNAINWLKNGGTVYATRLTQFGAKKAVASKGDTSTSATEVNKIMAKYPGTFYNDIELEFSWAYKEISGTIPQEYKMYSFTLKVGDYETFKAQSLNELIIRVNDSSDYIVIDNDFTISDSDITSKTLSCTLSNGKDKFEGRPDIIEEKDGVFSISENDKVHTFESGEKGIDITCGDKTIEGVKLSDAISYIKNNITDEDALSWASYTEMTENGDSTELAKLFPSTYDEFSTDELVRILFGKLDSAGSTIDVLGPVEYLLGNKLETPIDVILDAGYSEDTKKIISLYTRNKDQLLELARKDIVCIFDEYINDYDETNEKYTGKRPTLCDNSCIHKCDNRALYTQYFLVDDDYAKNIWVTPTYFLAQLIPHNDTLYGVQWPTAGLTRGVLLSSGWWC